MSWLIVNCSSGKERASCLLLDRLGYGETFYPQRKVDGRPRNKAKRAVSKAPRWIYRAWVPGYLFLCADDVEVHRINGTHGQIWMKVLSPGGVPYRVTDDDMARMQDVPSRVKALIEDVRKREIEERRKVAPQVGKLAKLVAGPFAGSEGMVEGIDGEDVRMQIGPLKVVVKAEEAKRVAA